MQVIAGSLRGRRLHAPRGRGVRPTLGRVREAIFSILGARVPGARVLDLYAGTGALGIEALSRGAARATFVERSRAHAAILARNVEELGLSERAEIWIGTAERALARMAAEGRRYDLVLADPPYGGGEAASLVARAAGSGIVAEGGVLQVQCATEEALPDAAGPLGRMSERVYGETKVAIYRAAPAEEPGKEG